MALFGHDFFLEYIFRSLPAFDINDVVLPISILKTIEGKVCEVADCAVSLPGQPIGVGRLQKELDLKPDILDQSKLSVDAQFIVVRRLFLGVELGGLCTEIKRLRISSRSVGCYIYCRESI